MRNFVKISLVVVSIIILILYINFKINLSKIEEYSATSPTIFSVSFALQTKPEEINNFAILLQETNKEIKKVTLLISTEKQKEDFITGCFKDKSVINYDNFCGELYGDWENIDEISGVFLPVIFFDLNDIREINIASLDASIENISKKLEMSINKIQTYRISNKKEELLINRQMSFFKYYTGWIE